MTERTIYYIRDEMFACRTSWDTGQPVKDVLASGSDTAKDQYLYSTSFTTAQNDLPAVLKKVTGKEWAVGYVAVEGCIRNGLKRREHGLP